MRKPFIFFTFLLLIPHMSFAAAGDILFRCTFEESGSTPADVVRNCGGNPGTMNNSSTLVTDGYNGRRALRYYYPNTGGEVIDLFSTPRLNKQEITVDYWEKFDVDPASSGIWNVKSIRPYVGSGSNDYMAAIMSLHNGAQFYQSSWGGTGTLTTTSEVASVSTSSGYCLGSGTSYTCPSGRMELRWKPSWGTTWHNIRIYIKVPSNNTSADGQTTVWIDGKQIYSLTNLARSSLWSSTWVPYTTHINFHPSDDFFQGISGTRFSFHHFYDDITVYEGYIPPTNNGIATTPTLSAPTYSLN